MEFHNINSDICATLYRFNKQLIANVCADLGHDDKTQEMVDKYLSDKFTKLKPIRDPSKPKKPLTAFMLFCNDNRERVSVEANGRLGDIAKILGKEWQSISAANKKPYILKSEELKDQYDEEIVVWKTQNKSF